MQAVPAAFALHTQRIFSQLTVEKVMPPILEHENVESYQHLLFYQKQLLPELSVTQVADS